MRYLNNMDISSPKKNIEWPLKCARHSQEYKSKRQRAYLLSICNLAETAWTQIMITYHCHVMVCNMRWDARPRGYLLGCTPQTCKPCSCPALRPKKEPGDSDRDINGLLDRASYRSAAKHPAATPHCVRQTEGKTWQQSSLLGEKEATIYRWNWGQAGSSVTRETSSWGRGQAHG